ncbi:MAG: peptide chain release factor 1 [Planctomycetota bacterium]
MLRKLERLAAHHAELEEQLGDPTLMGTPAYRRITREHARMGRLIVPYREARKAWDELHGARELLDDPDMAELAQEEVAATEAAFVDAMERIKASLVQADEAADRPAILEIRAGAGGDEACLFAGDLLRMYELFCQRQGWRIEPIDVHPAEIGGLKEGTFQISGEGVFGLLRYESGGHRVQRVPETESQGRIHTSAATVAVLPVAEEVDVDIDPADLRVDVFRASGAGGQHVNKTESAVRITHEPTGIVVSCQDGKSQGANKEQAMRVLRARLFELERERADAERAAARKQQVGSGDRSDRIRTYNFPQNRITDHRINCTAYNLDQYIDGHLEELQRAMIEHDKQRVLEEWDGLF